MRQVSLNHFLSTWDITDNLTLTQEYVSHHDRVFPSGVLLSSFLWDVSSSAGNEFNSRLYTHTIVTDSSIYFYSYANDFLTEDLLLVADIIDIEKNSTSYIINSRTSSVPLLLLLRRT